MKRNEIWQAVELEVRKSKRKLPRWPVHVVAQAAMVASAGSDVLTEAIPLKYTDASDREKLRDSAIRSAAAAIRFLENLKEDEQPKAITQNDVIQEAISPDGSANEDRNSGHAGENDEKQTNADRQAND